MKAKEISNRLSLMAEETAKYLLPNGKIRGDEFYVGSINGEVGESLKIKVRGEKKGVFCDFASNQKGDLLDLWALTKNVSIEVAIREVKGWLNLNEYELVTTSAPVFNKPFIPAPHLSANEETLHYLIYKRKLTKQSIDKFKLGSRNNEIIFPFYYEGKLFNAKYLSIERKDNKKIIHTEKNCKSILFGWQALSKLSRTIIITEGEIDAISFNEYGYEALSIPFGVNDLKWVENEYANLARFDRIYLCLDNDEPGKKATQILADRLGKYRCFIVELPFKDCNECLQNDIKKEQIDSCISKAKNLMPTHLKPAVYYNELVTKMFYPDANTKKPYYAPWRKAHGKVDFRDGELSVWTGINGHGKTQFLGQIMLSAMKQGAKVCAASLELKPETFLHRIVRQATGLRTPTTQYLEEVYKWYSDKLWMVNITGTAKADLLFETFLYAHQCYGVDFFVIDSLMKCGMGEEDYDAQKLFVEKLCDFKNDNNCQIHVVMHPRKGANEDKAPSKLDIKGTGALSDLADNCFAIWRNKNKERKLAKVERNGEEPSQSLLEEPDCLWYCDKQRNGEWEGTFALYFDKDSLQYRAAYTEQKARYVQFQTN